MFLYLIKDQNLTKSVTKSYLSFYIFFSIMCALLQNIIPLDSRIHISIINNLYFIFLSIDSLLLHYWQLWAIIIISTCQWMLWMMNTLNRSLDMLLPDVLEHVRRVLSLKLTQDLQTLAWFLVSKLYAVMVTITIFNSVKQGFHMFFPVFYNLRNDISFVDFK